MREVRWTSQENEGVEHLAFDARAALSQDQDKSKAEKPKKPALYDPKADARTQIDAATAEAKRQNARVLVMFGFEV